MLQAGIPAKFPIPFAKNAGGSYIRTIPQASQIGITSGAASLNDGFPPQCFIPTGSGGTPPWGQDFNGLLNQISAWNQWQQAGGSVTYDATFSSQIGGYPAGAIVLSATTQGVLYLCTADNNTSNPDSGGANWLSFGPGVSVSAGTTIYTGTDSGGANTLTLNSLSPTASSLSAGMLFRVTKNSTGNTSSMVASITTTGGTTSGIPLTWADGTALTSANWPGSVPAILLYTGSTLVLLTVMGPTVYGLAANANPIRALFVTTTQTLTVAANETRCKVRAWGGGGGGGGSFSTNSAGSGAGGGGFCEAYITGLTGGQTIVCTIGSGGAAGLGSPTNGTSGGATSFGSYITCNGGTFGTAGSGGVQNSSTGSGGNATVSGVAGSITMTGQNGGTGYLGNGTSTFGGIGGASGFGTTNASPNNGSNSVPAVGWNGAFPGGGASGGSWGAQGGAGANGLILVEFYH